MADITVSDGEMSAAAPCALPRLEAQLFGCPRVCWDRVPAPPSTVPLVAFLVLHPGRWHTRALVAARLHPDVDEQRARRRLNTALWRLRRWADPTGTAPAGVVRCRGDAIRLEPRLDVDCDVQWFESAVADLVDRPDPLSPDDVERLAAGVAGCGGELLEGWYDDWVLESRARLADLRLAVLYRLVTWHRARGHTAAVTRFGELVLATEPLREDVHRELIAAYAEAAQPARALRQFERCRRLLADELGVDPMPETLHLVARVHRGDWRARPPLPPALPQLVAELRAAHQHLVQLAELLERSLAALDTPPAIGP
jgi:DNA-binding SARP family transcriptional activator